MNDQNGQWLEFLWQWLSRTSDIVQVTSAIVAIGFAASAGSLRRRYLFQLRLAHLLPELNESIEQIVAEAGQGSVNTENIRDAIVQSATKTWQIQQYLRFFSRERNKAKELRKRLQNIAQEAEITEQILRQIGRDLRSFSDRLNIIYQDFQMR